MCRAGAFESRRCNRRWSVDRLQSFRDSRATKRYQQPGSLRPYAFVRIDRKGRVTLVMPQVEMGQGTYTSMSMLIAEELEVGLEHVALQAAPPDDRDYRNPLLGLQATRRLYLGAGDVGPAPPRRRCCPNHADNGRRASLAGGSRLLPCRERRSGPRAYRSATQLWRARRPGDAAARRPRTSR
jgi:Molybdopterin-binding domain of aldehyde dehydrogenase